MKIVIDIPNWLYNAIMECKEPHYSKSFRDFVALVHYVDAVVAEDKEGEQE